MDCAAGHHTFEKSVACGRCGKGRYSPYLAGVECAVCAAGSYQYEYGATECKTCSEGQFQADVGKTDFTNHANRVHFGNSVHIHQTGVKSVLTVNLSRDNSINFYG